MPSLKELCQISIHHPCFFTHFIALGEGGRFGLKKIECIYYYCFVSRWTRPNSCLFHSTSLIYCIIILLVNCGKFLPAQLVLSELHLEFCHVCLLPGVSFLCPNVEKWIEQRGRHRGGSTAPAPVGMAGPCASLSAPHSSRPALQLCRLCTRLP